MDYLLKDNFELKKEIAYEKKKYFYNFDNLII